MPICMRISHVLKMLTGVPNIMAKTQNCIPKCKIKYKNIRSENETQIHRKIVRWQFKQHQSEKKVHRKDLGNWLFLDVTYKLPHKTIVSVLTILALLSQICGAFAEGNVGCQYVKTLCLEGREVCFNDNVFGKCIPTTGVEMEDIEKTSLTEEQSRILATILEELHGVGLGWDHPFVQCHVQGALFSIQKQTLLPPNLCADIIPNPIEAGLTFGYFAPSDEIYPEYDYFRPKKKRLFLDDNSALDVTTQAHGYPEFKEWNTFEKLKTQNKQMSPSNFMKLLLTNKNIPTNFQKENGLKTQHQFNELKKDLKLKNFQPESLLNDPINFSQDKILSNKIDNSKIEPKERSYFRELSYEQNLEQTPVYDEYDQIAYPSLTNLKRTFVDKNFKNNNFRHKIFTNYETRNSLTPFEEEAVLTSNYYPSYHKKEKDNRIFTEAGLIYIPEEKLNDDNESKKSKSARDFLLSFTRHERLDVKKPGPVMPLPTLKASNTETQHISESTKELIPEHVNNNDEDSKKKKEIKTHSEIDHAPHSVDTEYAHVFVKNPIDSWSDGVRIMTELANILHMQGFFTYLTVQPHEVSFRVDSSNPDRKTASDVARVINESKGVKNNILRRLGVTVLRAGIGDKVKDNEVNGEVAPRIELAEQVPGITHIIAFMFAGAGAAAVIVIFITLILIKQHEKKRDKLGCLQSSVKSGAENCNKDYQDLCRARMAGKSNPSDPISSNRVTSLSKENERPPSSRSSTSSWSEEPALTNMDISTGHMVLSYMEDHLRNKGRLQREWEALCKYEAEPSARESALQPQCVNFNRLGAPLPYDHSRVVLNHLANAEGLDYINASTITDHDPRTPAYVAAQGPLPLTLSHFWQMIWEQGAVVVVALCRLQENGEIACARYWPEEGAEVYHIYEVHLVSEHIWCDDYLVRSFYLKNLRTGETRTVTQFHFLSWPNGGVPTQAKALLDFRRKVNKSYRGRSCPIVVHGSSGAGRTGAYILLDLVLGRMNKGAREIDIAATLEHLRDQRAGLVATRQQFEFVLMAVAEEVHTILKALPANQSNEKKELEASKNIFKEQKADENSASRVIKDVESTSKKRENSQDNINDSNSSKRSVESTNEK